jgi:hypothetical protein
MSVVRESGKEFGAHRVPLQEIRIEVGTIDPIAPTFLLTKDASRYNRTSQREIRRASSQSIFRKRRCRLCN